MKYIYLVIMDYKFLTCIGVKIRKGIHWRYDGQRQTFHQREEIQQRLHTYIRLFSTGTAEFCVAGEILDTFVSFISRDNVIILTEELMNSLDKLSDRYVFCCGLSELEVKISCPGISYDSKRLKRQDYPFSRLSSVKCIKWFRLRTHITSDEMDDAEKGNLYCTECCEIFRKMRYQSRRIMNKDVTKQGIVGIKRKRT